MADKKPTEFGVLNINIDGNSYTSKMITEEIRKVLNKYLNENHLFVNGVEIDLKK